MTENLIYYPRHGYVESHRAEHDGFRRVFFRKRLADDRSTPGISVEFEDRVGWLLWALWDVARTRPSGCRDGCAGKG